MPEGLYVANTSKAAFTGWVEFDGRALRAYHLQPDGSYLEAGRSSSFPFLPLRDVADFLQRYTSTDETAWVREVRGWARKLRS